MGRDYCLGESGRSGHPRPRWVVERVRAEEATAAAKRVAVAETSTAAATTELVPTAAATVGAAAAVAADGSVADEAVEGAARDTKRKLAESAHRDGNDSFVAAGVDAAMGEHLPSY